MNISGVNTAISEIEIDRMVKLISPAPASAASNGFSPCSMRCQITSTMTMASSTTKPTAMVSAISDRLSRLKFSASITARCASSASGITALGISVARTLRRNRKITITTSTMVISSVISTSLTEALMVWVRSTRMWMSMPGGMSACRPGSAASIRSTVLMTLAPGCLKMTSRMRLAALQGRVGVGLARDRPRRRSGCSRRSATASPMSLMRTGAPLW